MHQTKFLDEIICDYIYHISTKYLITSFLSKYFWNDMFEYSKISIAVQMNAFIMTTNVRQF